MIIHNIKQQTPEWFELKLLKLSASHATAIGNCGKGLDTYCKTLVKDFVKFKRGIEKENYTNKDIDRGNELEPIARSSYEFETGLTVKEVGFIQFSDYVGCSPDGLIYDNDKIIGGIEIKALNDDNHLSLLMDFKPDSGHIWQCQMSMLITGAEWWDYCPYNPNYNKSLIIHRVYPDHSKFEKLRLGFQKGILTIKSLLENPVIKNEL